MAIVIDAQGNLVDTEGRINFSPEGSDVLPPNPFLSPDTADSPYANLIGLPATQDMGFLYGVPQRADDQGYLTGLPGTADDVFPFEPPGTADDRIANLISVPGTADDVFPFAPKNRLGGLDLNRFEGIGSLGVANEEDVEQEFLPGQKKSSGIADLFRSILGFAIPGANFFLNKGRDVLGGIKSLNQRLRNTDFAKSSSLADYFDARKYGGRDERDAAAARNMAQARGIQKKIDAGKFNTGKFDKGITDRGRGNRTFSTKTTAPTRSFSKSYSDAKKAFRS
jgi:hypothetical protein